jgi:hypothetical protein
MIMKRLSLIAVFTLCVTLILVYGCTDSVKQEDQLKVTTLQVQKAVQSELDSLDRDLSGAASKLSRTGIEGAEARQILNGLCSSHPYLIDCSTVNIADKMVTVAPEAYERYEGSDISTHDVTVKFNETKKPTLSQMFTAVEGMDAVAIRWPILSEKGDFIGSLGALFKPETLFTSIVEPALKGTNIGEVNVLQLDGLTIFGSAGDTGKNLLTDPELKPYKDLVALGTTMIAQESGTGSYTITSHTTGKMVKKQVFWVSIKLHNTAWRLVSVR